MFIRPSLSPVMDYIQKTLGYSQLYLPAKVTNRKVDRLYKKAVIGQWSYKGKYPLPEYCCDVNDFLGIDDRTRFAAARSFSSFYHGEHGAKLISAQLMTLAPTHEAAQFLATQTMDEARHMEAFESILGFIDEIHPMNPFLNAFLGDINRTPHFEDKLVGMNLLVEGLALSAFRMTLKEFNLGKISVEGYQVIGMPIEDIVRDESRHVGFGVVLLPDLLSKLSRRRKASLRLRQMVWLALLYGSVKYQQEDQEILGLNYMELLNNLIEDHEKRVAECGGDALISTDRMTSLIPTVNKLVDKTKK